MSKGKILVIEPDEAYLDIEKFFTAQGHDVFCAVNGQSALDFISLYGMPAVIVMGYQLADTRGSDLVNTIRRIPKRPGIYQPWIVQLRNSTQYSYGDARLEYTDTIEIRLRIRYFLECHQKAQENKGTILIVEPDNDCRIFVRQILEADGYTVMSTADVEMGEWYAELNTPDIVIYGVEHCSAELNETLMWGRKKATADAQVIILYDTYAPDNKIREYISNLAGMSKKPIHPVQMSYDIRQLMRYIEKMGYFEWKSNLLQPLE